MVTHLYKFAIFNAQGLSLVLLIQFYYSLLAGGNMIFVPDREVL